eukprot:SAG22_NODE_1372_length_4577_cov_3.556052_3_plen_123_part_00
MLVRQLRAKSRSKSSLWKHVPTANLEGDYENLTQGGMEDMFEYYNRKLDEVSEGDGDQAEDEEAEDEEGGPLPDVAMPEQPLDGVLPSLVQFCDENRTVVGPGGRGIAQLRTRHGSIIDRGR